ncbi:4Fe-4S dicluster domain-containing protein [Campylobacter fetus]|uniref:4Fe-4S dicluster domain-containing protein n=1 Tax=Campylobacter fetus TaxID=196 RepID=UPI000508FD46|nr:4Fe-4S dicluster domain-containing protein [Campylobacter fetus]WKW17778.1 4Fe-4S dicluster domain-containing protein [Campylobacter fetus subsp. fetus]AIR78387.1 menaquinol dehydrogenase NosGH, periplasmic component NosG [Campylobacter fetus subsp. fetus 04/554]EAJ5693507.1 4Fe-4S dicluster domain-containing protein [Campylobacter fetus]EAJ5704522.1 4Fe-4S dicluster domain-containing protein [Campylobacter fetus]EAJ9256862.1 4Fe-4S dicluster domain-containing protein [Campylobacter fetus]
MNRRNFTIFSLATLACSAAAGYLLRGYEARNHLRPPGSVKHFESLCIKCGQCVQVCPYHSIELLGIDDGINLASAYIDPAKRGCYLCDLFPCVLSCPSGALDHNTTSIKDVKMGVAVVVNLKNCYANLGKTVEQSDVTHLLDRKAYNEREETAKNIIQNSIGKKCDLCVSSCPVSGAISIIDIEGKSAPKIDKSCVGCGVCSEVCFAKVIDIAPGRTYEEIYKE